jgi:hypothetical protein
MCRFLGSLFLRIESTVACDAKLSAARYEWSEGTPCMVLCIFADHFPQGLDAPGKRCGEVSKASSIEVWCKASSNEVWCCAEGKVAADRVGDQARSWALGPPIALQPQLLSQHLVLHHPIQTFEFTHLKHSRVLNFWPRPSGRKFRGRKPGGTTSIWFDFMLQHEV